MRGYRISVIRHGLTEANEKGIYIGTTDYSLSEAGKRQLYDKLDEYEYPRVQRVYSSPLKRCMETTEILFPDSEKMVVNNLREMNFGDFEGKSVEELINREDYKKWLKGGADNPPPNGETLQNLVVRTYRALNEIIRNMMSEDIFEAAIVTHAGVLSNMLSCFGVPKVKPTDLKCDAGEGYEILVTAQFWQQANAFEIIGQVPFLKD